MLHIIIMYGCWHEESHAVLNINTKIGVYWESNFCAEKIDFANNVRLNDYKILSPGVRLNSKPSQNDSGLLCLHLLVSLDLEIKQQSMLILSRFSGTQKAIGLIAPFSFYSHTWRPNWSLSSITITKLNYGNLKEVWLWPLHNRYLFRLTYLKPTVSTVLI